MIFNNKYLFDIKDNRHETKRNLRLRNGLITRHAYSVTGLARVRGQLGDTHLVRSALSIASLVLYFK